jgi:hypothetical protein
MAADDVDALGRLRLAAGQGRHHVDDFRRPRNALRDRCDVAVEGHLQRARLRAAALQLGLDPAPAAPMPCVSETVSDMVWRV